MKQIIPINAISEDVASCIPAHYYKAGWHDFDPTSNIPHTAILETDEVALSHKEIEMRERFSGISINPLDRKMEFFEGNQRGFDRVNATLAPTITAFSPNVAWFDLAESTEIDEPRVMCVASARPERSWQGSIKNQDRIYNPLGISPALHCCGGGNLEPKIIEPRYRIRKLTERECFRLMNVSDSDIDKIETHRIKVTQKNGTVKEKPIPKSAKYKLAGNSIVVSCLYHIFHQMFIAEPPKPKEKQLSLFDL